MNKKMALDNDRLLNLIQTTISEWKDAEEDLNDTNCIRIEELKELYQSLLREAKRRNLTLSKEQLINQIIYK